MYKYSIVIVDYDSSILASFAIFAGVLATSYGLDRSKNRKQNRKVEEEHNAKEPLDEQLA